MQNRRDHVQAYRFATGRMSSALVGGDAGAGEVPLRRARLGLVFGVLATVLVAAGFTVYGLINPGGATSWRQAGSVVVEKETGTRYLYLDGVLRPTANYASAMLGAASAAQGGTPTVRNVTRASLAGVPHGEPVGIVGAPEAAPDPETLLGDWAVCAGAGGGSALDLAPGTRPVRSLGDERLLVSDSRGAGSVLWRGTLFRVASRPAALALGLTRPPLAVDDAWLAAVPAGPALAPAPVPGVGRPAGAVAGAPAVVGQVFTTSVGAGPQYYVLRADGLAPATATEAALLGSVAAAPPARAVGPADLAALPVSPTDSLTRRLPDLVGAPDARLDAGSVCARQGSGGAPRGVAVSEVAASPDRTRVEVPPGRGMYAVEVPVVGRQEPKRWLVTETGIRYRLVDDTAVTALGLGGVTPVQVPSSVLAAVPVGPVMDPARALDPVRIVPVAARTGGGP